MESRSRTSAYPAALAAAVAVCAGGAFFLLDGVAQQVVYHCLSAGSAGAVLLGVRLHRPATSSPWTLLAVGLLVMTVADIAGDLVRAGAGVPDAVTPVLYALGWGLLALAVRALARHRAPEGDQDAVLDAAAIVLAVGLVLWRALLEPAVREPGDAVLTSVAVAFFPLAQIALLALYLRLLFVGGARLASAWVLAVGGGLLGLAGSTAYVVLVATGAETTGAWNNALWMAAYAAPGVAALLPDMRQLTEPAPRSPDLSMSRWTLLAAALVTTTATTSITATRMSPAEVVAAALPVPLLVLWRMRRVLLAEQDAVAAAERAARRHELLAELGASAVSTGIESLRAEACAGLSELLRAEVALVPSGLPPAPAVLVASVPTAPGPWRSLQADGGRVRRWDDAERSLLASVADVLSAAEARHAASERMAVLNADLRRANADLANANADLDGFAATVAHDLKNPLTVVSLQAEVLGDMLEDRPDGDRRAVATISRSAGRMHQLIDDLLSYSRAGDAELHLAPVDIGVMVDEVASELAAGAGGPIRVTQADLPVLHVEPALFRQVVFNVVENAIKYVAPGATPTVHVSCEPAGAGRVTLRVADNGIGIPAAAKEKVFTAFHREATTYPGTGLGLAICRRIVVRHGGDVWVEPNPTGGTIVCLSLPGAA